MVPKLRAWGGISWRGLPWICAAQMHKVRKTELWPQRPCVFHFPVSFQKQFFILTQVFTNVPPSRAVGGPAELWPKQWGWLRQGVFRALLLHNKSHQNTLACCRGDPQSPEEITATDICCHPAYLKKHSATDWRATFVSWVFKFKFMWPSWAEKHSHMGTPLPAESSWCLKPRVTALLIWDLVWGGKNRGLGDMSLCSVVPLEAQRTGKSWKGKLQFCTPLTWMPRVQKGYSKSLNFLSLDLIFLAMVYIS